jgi:acid phosphatase
MMGRRTSASHLIRRRGDRRATLLVGGVLLALAGASGVAVPSAVAVPSVAAVPEATSHGRVPLPGVKHLVVIYEENHSFDNLYGQWGRVGGRVVDGLAGALRTGRHVTQVAQDGTPYTCLLQNDVNLTSPSPLPTTCTDTAGTVAIESHFPNRPFQIDDYIAADDTTCPVPGVFAANGVLKGAGLPGGCTRDLVHRFYQEQYQIDGGKQDRYVTGSDAIGLTMGGYDTKQLPIYTYLHSNGAPKYVVADRFFQGAFGGSFLNHQWLIAGQAPVFEGAVTDGSSADLHSIVDTNGFPNTYRLYTPTTPVKDSVLTQACGLATSNPAVACGDYAVNTIQPYFQPFAPGTPDARRLRVDDTATAKNIGDELSDAGVPWAWYSGGWDNAAGNVGGLGWTNGATPGTCSDPRHVATAVYPNCPDVLFQYHHQPFAYFTRYAPGTADRAAHLKDDANFMASAKAGTLPAVSFVKPIGDENEHPGYASEPNGSQHLVDLLKAIQSGPDARNTLVVVTYDEFGGQWDHVSPPGAGSRTPGPYDAFGPGTRIPALVVGRPVEHSTVDHTSYDTTSIIATIERQYGLQPLTGRDAAVHDLGAALRD